MTLAYMRITLGLLMGFLAVILWGCGVKGEPTPYVESEAQGKSQAPQDASKVNKDK